MTTHFSLGYSGTPVEEATCTLNFNPGGQIWTLEDVQGIADDAYADWAAWIVNTDAKVSSAVRLDGLKLYSIDSTGHIDQDPVIAAGAPVSGTTNINLHPFQCSVVMTLVAGVRGKGRFGRIYLPPQGFQVDPDGVINDSHRASMFAATKTLLTNLSNLPAVDLGFGLAVAGRTGTGTLRAVDSVRMGKVCDTQRRRRRSLEEAYLTEAFSG